MNPEQVEQQDLDWADKIVFMTEENRTVVKKNLDIEAKSETWNIPDADPGGPLKDIYRQIEGKVDKLEKSLN